MNSPVVTLNGKRYAVQRQWIAPDVDLRGISSVAVLDHGHVAVLFRTAPQIRIFDARGRVAATWDVPGLICPHHITAVKGGGALVTDLDGHQVVCLDARGEVVWTLGKPEHPQWMAPFNHPTQAAFDADGKLYVTDGYGNFCLHRFDQAQNLLETHGEAGQGEGQFSTPHAVVVGTTGLVYVADRENSRVQVFDQDGRFQRQLTAMYKPMALALTPDGNLLVSDQTATIVMFDTVGNLLGRCRVFGVYGHGLAAGPDGAIYISEMIPDCLTRLMPVHG